MKVWIAIAVMSSIGLAQSTQCLRQASNAELLNEIDRRLGGHGGGSQGYARADYMCRGSELIISHLSVNGTESTETVDIVYSSRCQDAVTTLRQNASIISSVRSIGVCVGGMLHRFNLSVNQLVRSEPRDFVYESRCQDEARRLNGPM